MENTEEFNLAELEYGSTEEGTHSGKIIDTFLQFHFDYIKKVTQ
jgi:hypothetical protein